jgi:hypothetical protein
MHQKQDVYRNGSSAPRSGTPRRIGAAIATAVALVPAGFVVSGGPPPAGALTIRPHAAVARSANTTVPAVVTPTTSVTTTAGPVSVPTATTTVPTSPTSTTSTTVTKMAPTTTVPPTSNTTTTQAPQPTTTTTTTTTTTIPPAPSPASPPAAPRPAIPSAAPTFDRTCSQPATPGLQTYLDSLPAGSIFQSSTTACYEVPSGIVLRKAITIIGGTFYDPTTVKPTGPGYDSMKPIILLKDASHVTLSGLAVLGANATGVYHSSMVGEAGVKLESTSDVTITGVTAKDTWGDGLELVADLSSHNGKPVTGLTVDGFTTTNAGRQGVTLAEVSGASLDHVNVINPADAGFDFESDLPNVGSANVSISNCTDTHGFNLIEFFSGPITITNCTSFHHVSLGSLHSNAPISFVGGHLSCKRIDPQPCIHQNGGSLRFTGVTIDRLPGVDKIRQPLWSVDNGGKLVFVESQILWGFGTVANGASVQIVK